MVDWQAFWAMLKLVFNFEWPDGWGCTQLHQEFHAGPYWRMPSKMRSSLENKWHNGGITGWWTRLARLGNPRRIRPFGVPKHFLSLSWTYVLAAKKECGSLGMMGQSRIQKKLDTWEWPGPSYRFRCCSYGCSRINGTELPQMRSPVYLGHCVVADNNLDLHFMEVHSKDHVTAIDAASDSPLYRAGMANHRLPRGCGWFRKTSDKYLRWILLLDSLWKAP